MSPLDHPWKAASDPYDYPAAMERQEKKIAELEASRDYWKRETEAWKSACKASGVCMSCATGLSGPCTDCLGTGWNNGHDPFEAEQSERQRRESAEAVIREICNGTLSAHGWPQVATAHFTRYAASDSEERGG